MSGAALYLNPEAFDTKGTALMGRQAAGESFLRGYLRHAQTDRFDFWNVANRSQADLQAFVTAIEDLKKPVRWIGRQDRMALGEKGVAHLPSPSLAKEAWARRTIRANTRYAISAITHTTASQNVTDMLADLITAPIEPWDCLICTSTAVRASVETQLQAVSADLEERLGATRLPKPWLTTIPLGVNVDDFARSPEQRAAWRQDLDIPQDAIVVLYVGRFNPHAKMNPIPMAMALQRAAEASSRPIAWVQAGWSGSDGHEKTYHAETQRFCPDVLYRVVDGRKPETRFSIWSVGDIFISLSDNIQETFGLTPVEAMAAGLPCVVSDWDGYRDTVRHGVDGFRISTYAPRAGMGEDLAYRHASGWLNYDGYVGAASQLTAVDVGEAAKALLALIENADLRARMGEAAQVRACTVFDWSAVVPQYEGLWAEMNRLRQAATQAPAPRRDLALNPRRLDPFLLFGGYATEWFTPSTFVTLTPGQSRAALQFLLDGAFPTYGGSVLPSRPELEAMVDRLVEVRQTTAGELASRFSPGRQPFIERGLLWLAKYQVLTILPRSSHIA